MESFRKQPINRWFRSEARIGLPENHRFADKKKYSNNQEKYFFSAKIEIKKNRIYRCFPSTGSNLLN